MLETTYDQLLDQTRLIRALSCLVLKISKLGDSRASLSKPLHCLTVLMVKKISLNPLEQMPTLKK